jgi:DNA-directed RNA polymerase beta subunit
MDLSGMLLAGLFRMLFAKMQKELARAIQKSIERGKSFTLSQALNTNIITAGLRYSLATGMLHAVGRNDAFPIRAHNRWASSSIHGRRPFVFKVQRDLQQPHAVVYYYGLCVAASAHGLAF